MNKVLDNTYSRLSKGDICTEIRETVLDLKLDEISITTSLIRLINESKVDTLSIMACDIGVDAFQSLSSDTITRLEIIGCGTFKLGPQQLPSLTSLTIDDSAGPDIDVSPHAFPKLDYITLEGSVQLGTLEIPNWVTGLYINDNVEVELVFGGDGCNLAEVMCYSPSATLRPKGSIKNLSDVVVATEEQLKAIASIPSLGLHSLEISLNGRLNLYLGDISISHNLTISTSGNINIASELPEHLLELSVATNSSCTLDLQSSLPPKVKFRVDDDLEFVSPMNISGVKELSLIANTCHGQMLTSGGSRSFPLEILKLSAFGMDLSGLGEWNLTKLRRMTIAHYSGAFPWKSASPLLGYVLFDRCKMDKLVLPNAIADLNIIRSAIKEISVHMFTIMNLQLAEGHDPVIRRLK